MHYPPLELGEGASSRPFENEAPKYCEILMRGWDAQMKVLANELKGKTVMSDDGLKLGRLRNIEMNQRTGDLTDVLIEPSGDVDPRLFKRDERGYLIFPFENVQAVRDVVIMNTAE